MNEEQARRLLETHGQDHLMRFWPELDNQQRERLLRDIESVDFDLMKRLIERWVLAEPAPEQFDDIQPIPTIGQQAADHDTAWQAGEEALRAGRVGLFLVAGGQGTRLGFDGPKGAYPIGPVTEKSIFEYHADKIHNLQRRYGCTLPWYIMVSHANAEATRSFFQDNEFFGLKPTDVKFFKQRMVPCVDTDGKFLLADKDHLAMNPNGHGGCIPALVENGICQDARARGIDILSYFQVDNWAVKVADPLFIGYHVLHGGQMSSKIHRKEDVREAVGVHCLCDGQYRVIEYSELDIYPQLLETDEDGRPVFYAGNPAMHCLAVPFVQSTYDNFDQFPWHRAFKKIPHVDESGTQVKPDEENGYKFETFVFDALRFTQHEPVALEIQLLGEFTPVKRPDGKDSVESAVESMRLYWGEWLEAAGAELPKREDGVPAIDIEISPRYALSKAEFLDKNQRADWPTDGPVVIDGDGELRR